MLADFRPTKVEIEHNGKPLVSVRGLCLDDISILVRAHLITLNKIAEQAKAGVQGGVFGVNDLFMLELIAKAPDAMWDIIALASDEPEYGDNARKMPASLQIKILTEVMRLTLEDIGGPKALIALVAGLMKQVEPGALVTTT